MCIYIVSPAECKLGSINTAYRYNVRANFLHVFSNKLDAVMSKLRKCDYFEFYNGGVPDFR